MHILDLAWIPLISGLVWLGGLIALLASWGADGHPLYIAFEAKVPYVSDLGAHFKTCFMGNFGPR